MVNHVYIVIAHRFNGDFTTTDYLDAFEHCRDARACINSLENLSCNAFTKFEIKGLRLRDKF